MTTIASMTLLTQNREAIDKTYAKIAKYSNISDGSQLTKEQHYYDLSPELAGRSIDIQSKITQIQSNIERLKGYDPYIGQYSHSIIEIGNLATEVKDFMVKAIGIYGSEDMLNIKEEATGYLNRIELLLNIQMDGKYLYAGSKNVEPAPNLLASNLSSSNTANQDVIASYYQGDQTAESIYINGRQTTLGITGDHQGFAELICSLHYLINAVDTKDGSVQREKIDRAAKLADSAFTKINELKANIGNVELVVKEALKLEQYKLENLRSLYDNQLNGVNDLYMLEMQKLFATSSTQMNRTVAITKKLLEMLEMSGNLLLN